MERILFTCCEGQIKRILIICGCAAAICLGYHLIAKEISPKLKSYHITYQFKIHDGSISTSSVFYRSPELTQKDIENFYKIIDPNKTNAGCVVTDIFELND